MRAEAVREMFAGEPGSDKGSRRWSSRGGTRTWAEAGGDMAKRVPAA